MAARKTAKRARTSKKASRSVPLFVLGERDREILATVQRAGLFTALDEAQLAEIAGAYQADGMSPALFDLAERHAFSRASQDLALRAPSSAPGVAPFGGVLIDDMSGSRRVYLRVPGQKTRVFAVTTYQDWADLLDLTLAALGDPRRLVALHNEQDDVGEQAYLVATAEQAAVLAEVGWTASWTLPGDPREIDGDEHARTLLPEVRRRLERAGVVGAAEARGGEIRLALDEEARARLVLAFHHMDRYDAALGHRLASLETEDDPETGILLSPPIRARLAGLTALGVVEAQSRAEDDRLAQRLATDNDLVFAIRLSFRISPDRPRHETVRSLLTARFMEPGAGLPPARALTPHNRDAFPALFAGNAAVEITLDGARAHVRAPGLVGTYLRGNVLDDAALAGAVLASLGDARRYYPVSGLGQAFVAVPLTPEVHRALVAEDLLGLDPALELPPPASSSAPAGVIEALARHAVPARFEEGALVLDVLAASRLGELLFANLG